MENNQTVTNEELAKMIKKGFDGVDEKFDGVDEKFKGVTDQLFVLEQGQEEIKLKLDNVAYRFELIEL